MAKLSASFEFIGPISNLSAYRMRGVDGIILRKKGGASKSVIKRSYKFELTRKANAEFGGRSAAGKWARAVLHRQKPLADYNISGPINALLLAAQKMDTVNLFGKRNVLLSKIPWLLDGFSLNRTTPFDSIIRTPLLYTISRNELSAHIEIPQLRPGINFHTKEKHPFYSLVVSLGIVPDLFFSRDDYRPSSKKYKQDDAAVVDTSWYPVLQGSEAISLDMKYRGTPPDQSFTLLLSIGIRFGTMPDGKTVQGVPYAGAAKILVGG